MIVLDTAILLFWTLDRRKLSAQAKKAITSAEKILISSISIWEIGIKVKRGKLTIPLTLRSYTEKLKLIDKVEIIPVTEETWIRNIELDWDHKDPADRTIVAMAGLFGTPLVTSDRKIRKFYLPSIW